MILLLTLKRQLGSAQPPPLHTLVSKRLSSYINYFFCPLADTSPFSPICSSTRQAGQYHFVVLGGRVSIVNPTHGRWNHSYGHCTLSAPSSSRRPAKTRNRELHTYLIILASNHLPKAHAVAQTVPLLIGIHRDAILIHLHIRLLHRNIAVLDGLLAARLPSRRRSPPPDTDGSCAWFAGSHGAGRGTLRAPAGGSRGDFRRWRCVGCACAPGAVTSGGLDTSGFAAGRWATAGGGGGAQVKFWEGVQGRDGGPGCRATGAGGVWGWTEGRGVGSGESGGFLGIAAEYLFLSCGWEDGC